MKTNLLPIYTATAIEEAPIAGGSTYPCLMSVDIGNGEQKKYVVKILKQTTLQEYFPIHSEVIASILAREFDLFTPDIALIQVPSFFIHELCEKPPYQKSKNELIAGVYFGSEYIEGAEDVTSKQIEQWEDIDELQTIFAFDMLIQNTDRRQGKPNSFMKDEYFYLIDHELSLNTNKLASYDATLSANLAEQHLLYPFLNSLPKKIGLKFDSFRYYLRQLDPNVIDNYILQLNNILKEKNEYDATDLLYDDHTLTNYLYQIKNNPTYFIQELQLIL